MTGQVIQFRRQAFRPQPPIQLMDPVSGCRACTQQAVLATWLVLLAANAFMLYCAYNTIRGWL